MDGGKSYANDKVKMRMKRRGRDGGGNTKVKAPLMSCLVHVFVVVDSCCGGQRQHTERTLERQGDWPTAAFLTLVIVPPEVLFSYVWI